MGHEFGDLQDGAFLLFALEFFVHALGYGFAFFLAVFRTFALGVFRRQGYADFDIDEIVRYAKEKGIETVSYTHLDVYKRQS